LHGGEVDEAAQGPDAGGCAEEVGDGVAVGVAAGERGEVILGEEALGLVDAGDDDIADGDGRVFEPGEAAGDAAGAEHRLEGDAADVRAGEAEAEGLAQVWERGGGHDHGEGRGDAGPAALVDGAAADLAEVGPAEVKLPGLLHAVELHVELELAGGAAEVGETAAEARVAGRADAVGVDEDVADAGVGLGPGQDVEELGVERGLTARELEDVEEALAVEDGGDAGLDLAGGGAVNVVEVAGA
jgi:hypothetical protein